MNRISCLSRPPWCGGLAFLLAASWTWSGCVPEKPKANLKTVESTVNSLLEAAQKGDTAEMRECLEALNEPKITMKEKELKEFVTTTLHGMGIDDFSARFQEAEATYDSPMGGPRYVNVRLTNGKVTYWVFHGYFDGLRVDLWTPGMDAKPMLEAAEKGKYIRLPDD